MSVSGWITCYCGQEIPAYLGGPDAHYTPTREVCKGIDHTVHTSGVCAACRFGTHDPVFVAALEGIRRDRVAVAW